jgi:chemotaxis protein histidine kinase CheA
MACFKIHTKVLKSECGNISQEVKNLNTYVNEINAIATDISLGHSTASIKKTLQNISTDIKTGSTNIALFSSKLNDIIVEYETTEARIIQNNTTPNTIADTSGNEKNSESPDEAVSEDDELKEMIWTILSFIPGLNCIADIRQIFKDLKKVLDGDTPTVSEIMGILMDVAFLAMDSVSALALAKNIGKGIKAAKLASTAAKDASQKAAKAAKAAEKAASKTGKTVAKTKAAKKAAKAANKAENAAKKAEAAKKASKTAKKEAAKNAIKETMKATADNVKDEYVPSPDNNYIPGAIQEDARDQMIG